MFNIGSNVVPVVYSWIYQFFSFFSCVLWTSHETLSKLPMLHSGKERHERRCNHRLLPQTSTDTQDILCRLINMKRRYYLKDEILIIFLSGLLGSNYQCKNSAIYWRPTPNKYLMFLRQYQKSLLELSSFSQLPCACARQKQNQN